MGFNCCFCPDGLVWWEVSQVDWGGDVVGLHHFCSLGIYHNGRLDFFCLEHLALSKHLLNFVQQLARAYSPDHCMIGMIESQ